MDNNVGEVSLEIECDCGGGFDMNRLRKERKGRLERGERYWRDVVRTGKSGRCRQFCYAVEGKID